MADLPLTIAPEFPGDTIRVMRLGSVEVGRVCVQPHNVGWMCSIDPLWRGWTKTRTLTAAHAALTAKVTAMVEAMGLQPKGNA